MAVEFDPAKDAANIAKHGVSLTRAGEVALEVFVQHTVKGEARIRGFGLLDGRPHCLVFTYRGANVRAISLRRASQEEMDDAAGEAAPAHRSEAEETHNVQRS